MIMKHFRYICCLDKVKGILVTCCPDDESTQVRDYDFRIKPRDEATPANKIMCICNFDNVQLFMLCDQNVTL